MGTCEWCKYEPRWDSDDPDAKGLCRWAEQFSGIPLPASIKPWIRLYDDSSKFINNMMHPVTRESCITCLSFEAKSCSA